MQVSIPLIFALVFMAFIVSIPCGYIRQNYKKYSFMWFLLIHFPIPIIVMMRIGIGIDWRVIPLTLCGSVAGQIVGGALNRRRKQ